MAEESLPFNGEIVNQDEWELYHAPLQDDGIYGQPGGPVGQVYADSTGLQVKRRAVAGWAHGSYFRDLAEKIVPITPNGSSQPRIDRIVERRDNATKVVTTIALPGTAQQTPTPPPLTQNAGGTWDVPLAQVYVDPGAVSIANGKVTDERSYVGLRLWRPSGLSLLPTSGVQQWQEAVLPDGTKCRWNGTQWLNFGVDQPPTPWVMGVSTAWTWPLGTGSRGRWNRSNGRVEGWAVSVLDAAPPYANSLTLTVPGGTPIGATAGDSVGEWEHFRGSTLLGSGTLLTFGSNFEAVAVIAGANYQCTPARYDTVRATWSYFVA